METWQPQVKPLSQDWDRLLFLGTAKGVQLYRGNTGRNSWQALGNALEEHDISALAWDQRTPEVILAGTAAGKLFISQDSGYSWKPTGAEFPDQKIWSITPDLHVPAGSLYLGVDGGHLFYSRDNGTSWREVGGLRELPDAPHWFGPFGPAIFHSILPVPDQPGSLYLGLSVVGVLHSKDGGLSWQDTTANIPRVGPIGEGGPMLADVHKLALHPLKPARMYATTHYGMFRSDDGSQFWENISKGIPYEMTRPLALHPRDPDTVYIIAHQDGSDNELPIIRGPLIVYRSRDGGQHWEGVGKGLPEQIECAVLREALATDEGEPCSVYLGTNRGQLFTSYDEGDNWQLVAKVNSSIRVVRVQTISQN
jgi:photosystem II stability/assembly factor-like uncharacterized protein